MNGEMRKEKGEMATGEANKKKGEIPTKARRNSPFSILLSPFRSPFRRTAAPAEGTVQPRLLPITRAFGLDISDASLEAMECGWKNRQLTLRAYNRVLLDQGVIVDGEMKDRARFLEAVQQLKATARPERFSRTAVVGVPEKRVYLHNFEFPVGLSTQDIRDAIPFQVEGVLPIELSEMVTDISVHRSRTRNIQHVLFAAVPRVILEQYLDALDEAGIEVVAFDPESAATARALVKKSPEPSLLVDIGARRTTLLVIDRGELHGVVTVSFGGDRLTEVIARAAGVDQNQADEMKMRDGLTDTMPAVARSSLEEELKTLIQELQQLARAHEQHAGRDMREVVLAGGGALLPGIAPFLQGALQREVRIGDPFTVSAVAFPPVLSPADIEWLQRGRLFFATSVGLAARGTQRNAPERGLNLLPFPRRSRYLFWREKLLVTSLALGTALAWTGLFIVLGTAVLRAEFALRRVRAEAEPVRAAIESERFTDTAQEVRRLNEEVQVVRAAAAQRLDLRPTLERIRNSVLLGVRLVGVRVQVDPGTPKTFSLDVRGVADTREQFLEFEKKIRQLPGVQSVVSPLTNLDRPLAAPFSLSLTVAAEPPVPVSSP